MARADRRVRSPACRSRFSRFLHSRTVFRLPSVRDRLPAPIAAGRGGFLRAVCLRQRNGLPCRAHQRRRTSRLAAISCPGALARPHGHEKRSSPLGRPAHFVFPRLWPASRVVSIFPARCLPIPRRHRARRKAPARPSQAQLTSWIAPTPHPAFTLYSPHFALPAIPIFTR